MPSGRSVNVSSEHESPFVDVAVQDHYTSVRKDALDVLLFAGFELMIPKHGENGDFNSGDFFGENRRFLR